MFRKGVWYSIVDCTWEIQQTPKSVLGQLLLLFSFVLENGWENIYSTIQEKLKYFSECYSSLMSDRIISAHTSFECISQIHVTYAVIFLPQSPQGWTEFYPEYCLKIDVCMDHSGYESNTNLLQGYEYESKGTHNNLANFFST